MSSAQDEAQSVDVLIICDRDDQHGDAVTEVLEARGSSVARINLQSMRTVAIEVTGSAARLRNGGSETRIDQNTTVWWRRAGRVDTADLQELEQRLVGEEMPQFLYGLLLSSGARCIDDPFEVARAEVKLFQLSQATRLGLKTPPTLVTNDPKAATNFSERSKVVIKALSSGEGIAPFVDMPSAEELAAVRQLPTMIQRLVPAKADVRVVVVGNRVWAWERAREKSTVDWRMIDPKGHAFATVDAEPSLRSDAAALTSACGLTMSVQDWLSTSDGLVFLELNPQGAFLFLDGAVDVVVPAVADRLRNAATFPGAWPSARKRFAYDFLRSGRAPSNDGIVAPEFPPPTWLRQVARDPHAMQVARDSRLSAEEAAKTAEEKAHRLTQTCLTLLAIAIALGSYQLSAAVSSRSWSYLLVLPVTGAVAMLAVAAFGAIELDRVGVYRDPLPADLAACDPTQTVEALLQAEEQGRQCARWTAKHKHTELMQARAWFTRGLASLIVAGVVAAISVAVDLG